MAPQILVQFPVSKFHKGPFSSSRVVIWAQMDRALSRDSNALKKEGNTLSQGLLVIMDELTKARNS